MTIIRMRQGTAAEWTTANPILDEGEPGYEADTKRQKIGDGVTHWNALPYFLNETDINARFETIVLPDESPSFDEVYQTEKST